jgi:salicylate hydroxylase
LKEVGAGVSISPNGSAVLFGLGLEQPVRACAVSANQREVKLWNTGHTWSLYRGGPPSEQRYGYPAFALHRVDLHNILLEAVRSLKRNAIHLERRCLGFEQDGTGVELSFAGGSKARGDLLIGSDGIHSQIRRQLFGASVPRFTGQVAWRGLASMDRLPPSLSRSAQVTWIGPSAHISCYPVRRGELFNFVGQVDRSDWQVESWIEEGTVEECLADFPGWHPDVRHMIESNTKLYKWALFLRDPLPNWTVARVALLGDACHSMLPYLGQGANSALEDGFILARSLEDCVDAEAGLQRYEAARRERTTQLVHASAEMARTFHHKALAEPESAQKYIAAEWHPDRVRARYDWIYGYDAGKVAIA